MTAIVEFQEASLTNQETLENEIKELKQQFMAVLISNVAVSPSNLPVLPIKTIEELDGLELFLRKPEDCAKLVFIITKVYI